VFSYPSKVVSPDHQSDGNGRLDAENSFEDRGREKLFVKLEEDRTNCRNLMRWRWERLKDKEPRWNAPIPEQLPRIGLQGLVEVIETRSLDPREVSAAFALWLMKHYDLSVKHPLAVLAIRVVTIIRENSERWNREGLDGDDEDHEASEIAPN
jgi:hypothetical protein